MRTPITYYGGKQTMLKEILPRLWTKRDLYVEPFFGGGAVFFSKGQEKNEVINDKSDFVINFYEVLKNDFEALNKMVQGTLYSESLYQKAAIIYDDQLNFDKVTRAWAFWALSIMSFGRIINSSSGFSCRIEKAYECPQKLQTKKAEFTQIATRLENVCIRNRDALEIIQKYDYEGAFFYIDPPYVGANQGHYKGYTQESFNALLETLSHLKGKFLLSSYENESLKKYKDNYDWQVYKFDMQNYMAKDKEGSKSRKTEVLTANYDISEGERLLLNI